MSDKRNPDENTDAGYEVLSRPHLVFSKTDFVHSKRTDFVDRLYEATTDLDHGACQRVVQEALDAGVSAEDIADKHIPEVARWLGDDWCSDETSFAHVTIGVARLRSALRLLGPAWVSDAYAEADTPTVLLIVAEGAQHTLGATIVAGQLRRMGLSVRLCIGNSLSELRSLSNGANFDAVLISASFGESLESLRLIVEIAKKTGPQERPVVLGGTIVADTRTVSKLTGADLVTADLKEAISFCGLKIKLRQNQLTGD